jgi:hypothetical protein
VTVCIELAAEVVIVPGLAVDIVPELAVGDVDDLEADVTVTVAGKV